MSWFTDLISGAGEFLKGASLSKIVSSWLEKDDNSALNDIEEFVRSAPSELIDEMDAFLLQYATYQLSIEKRERLIKFYSFFKIIEYRRFDKWRGFPK